MIERAETLKRFYGLRKHEEGGSFTEVYTSAASRDDRAYMGSIYFLLDEDEISHFHQIDCEEIWYFHEGCGMKITVLKDGRKQEFLLGNDIEKGQKAMIVIEKDSIFASENLDRNGYSFVSCATSPAFTYEGFSLIYRQQIKEGYPDIYEEIEYLAY